MRVDQLGRRLRRAGVAAVTAALLVVGLVPAASFASPSAAATHHASTSGVACLVATPPTGVAMPAPFLKLPLRARDAVGSLYNTQGWITSPDELSIDDETNGDLHGANDLEFVRTPDYGYGLPVLAAASGRAYFSYQYISGSWTDPSGVMHQVGQGAGLFVEVRHAQDQPGNAGWVTQYIHLSQVAAGIPYLPPVPAQDSNTGQMTDWFPQPITQSDDTLWNLGVPVQQGQVIGYMGDTGIGLDWKDNFNVTTGNVAPRDRRVLQPWDPPQLHFQLYQGRVNGVKQHIIDPFGLYAQVCPGEWKPGSPRVNPYGAFPGFMQVAPSSAFLTDLFGHHPEYASW